MLPVKVFVPDKVKAPVPTLVRFKAVMPPSRMVPAKTVLSLLRPTVSVVAANSLKFSTKPVPAKPPIVLLKPLRRRMAGLLPCAERICVEFGLNAAVAPDWSTKPGKVVVPA